MCGNLTYCHSTNLEDTNVLVVPFHFDTFGSLFHMNILCFVAIRFLSIDSFKKYKLTVQQHLSKTIWPVKISVQACVLFLIQVRVLCTCSHDRSFCILRVSKIQSGLSTTGKSPNTDGKMLC
jgi:hypothetical protein